MSTIDDNTYNIKQENNSSIVQFMFSCKLAFQFGESHHAQQPSQSQI